MKSPYTLEPLIVLEALSVEILDSTIGPDKPHLLRAVWPMEVGIGVKFTKQTWLLLHDDIAERQMSTNSQHRYRTLIV